MRHGRVPKRTLHHRQQRTMLRSRTPFWETRQIRYPLNSGMVHLLTRHRRLHPPFLVSPHSLALSPSHSVAVLNARDRLKQLLRYRHPPRFPPSLSSSERHQRARRWSIRRTQARLRSLEAAAEVLPGLGIRRGTGGRQWIKTIHHSTSRSSWTR